MYRSKILNLVLYGNNTGSKIALISSRPTTNLKRQNLTSFLNDICSKNDKKVTDDIAESIYPIVINDISLNLQNNEPTIQNSLHKQTNQCYLTSTNYVFTKRNILFRTSSVLLAKNNSLSKLHQVKPLGVRNLSTEATQHVPIIQLTGIWKDMSESAPVGFVQDSLISFQSTTHLPWWVTVILTTFVVRSTMTLPLTIYQHYILAKVHNLQHQMKDTVEKLKKEANVAVSYHGWSEDYARHVYNESVNKKWKELIQKENCHPAKGLIVLWTQIPLWLTISAALRNLCYMLPPGYTNAEKIYLELATGGFGWITNLVDVDHYWIIPLSVGIFNLANIELMSLMKISEETKLQRYILYFLRFISIAMVPIATYIPSCICLYWASSSAFGVAQNLLLLSPKVRRFGGVPITSIERVHPYRELFEKFRARKYINFRRKSTNLE